MLVGSLLLLAGAPFTSAQTGEAGSVPDTPNQPSGSAIWAGIVDIHWNEVAGADSYDVQYFHISSWIDLPSADEDIDIAFYGAGAVVRGLSHSSTSTFQVRAVNSHGASEWSQHGWLRQTDRPSAWANVPEPANVPATGKPRFSGSLAVGELLTVDTSGISDENGLDRVKFYYQWISNDGTTETEIAGGTGPSFRLTDAYVGKTIRVRVSFTDRHGFSESLTNTANSNNLASGAPTISGNRWVGGVLTADTSTIQDADGLTGVDFMYQWLVVGSSADEHIEGATAAAYTLTRSQFGKGIRVRVTFTDDIGNEETLVSEATAAVKGGPNTPATGVPTIRGRLTPGHTLTADISDIQDEGGLENASFSYQWNVVVGTTETDIAGATRSTYRLGLDDVGKTFNVRASFTDDHGHAESLTSAATEAVTCYEPSTPTEVAVAALPIVVTSTEDDYFVLYVSYEADGKTFEYPVLVKLGEEGTTTLAENVEALPADRYRVEKYLVESPGDVDGDCTDDITEISNLGPMNPVNSGASIDPSYGSLTIPDRETFESLAVTWEAGKTNVKFILKDMDTDRPSIYFADTNKEMHHHTFLRDIDVEEKGVIKGHIQYEPTLTGPDGSQGVYLYHFPLNNESFSFGVRAYALLAANMPVVDSNLALWIRNGKLPAYRDDLPLYRASRIDLKFDVDVFEGVDFQALNEANGYGVLRSLEADERPHPRDVVIYQALPNELPRVAGIITTVPQTLLAHVNLRAVQDGVPNAFIRDALDNDDIEDLIDSHVYYQVTTDGYTIRAATQAEVNAHYASSRPTSAQTPERDLSVTTITSLSEIGFDDWDAFGVKAANVAVLGTLGFPEGTVPSGFAVPFYFYDEFMKHNELYDDIEEMLADEDFQSDYDTMASELKKLRKKIKKAETPDWIVTALTTMHATYPEGQSLRYRSSTNNEDLPNFSGAGLYDSKTQHPEETEEDGISKSLKQVYASLWNFRAYLEREFHRVNHSATAMGVLVHPNYSDEQVNGVAVSFDPTYSERRSYYVNSQVGEDMVTNPQAASMPEEVLLRPNFTIRVVRLSNQVQRGQLLMTSDQLAQLRRHLAAIHDKFKELYGIEFGEQFAMEIEFKITSDNVLAIKQARPWSFSPAANAPNSPSTGNPTITGAPQVGETLTADTSGIADEDGLNNVTFSYQWMANDADISGATSASYTLTSGDRGKVIKVRVSFTDDAGIDETLSSPPLDPSRPYGLSAAVSGRTVVLAWSPPTSFSYLYDYRIMRKRPEQGESEPVVLADTRTSETTYTDSDVEPGVLYEYSVKAANFVRLSRASEPVEIRTPERLNSPATGAPAIGGTAQVGETLTADQSGIADTDGLTNVTFSYQWLADDADLSGATGSSYTLSDSDEGKAIKVRASFTDDAGNAETLDSVATAAVEARPNSPAAGAPAIGGTAQVGETLTADPSGIADTDGLTNVTFSYQWLADDADLSGATGSSYTLTDSDEGKAIKVRASFTDDAGNAETLDSDATAAVEARPNSPATGAPAISGTAQVGETLTADTLGIADADGLTNATFSYQWLADDADISGATGSSYTLTDSDEGKAIKVRASFTDDAGNAETLDSDATAAVEARPNSPATGAPAISGTAQVGETLTADPSGIADTDGLTNVTFSYQWLADDSEISGATGSSYTLTDSDEGKAIKVRASFTDDAGNAETLDSVATAAVEARPNSPATGAPAISGTVQVGETLTADTSGIADTDGLTNATFSYQWLADDSEISGATGSSYTLTDSDEGKAIKVRASFTDDAGNAETLTSVATAAVESAFAWESELTVGQVPDVLPEPLGYSGIGNFDATLSPNHFEIDGTTYIVQYLLQYAESVWLGTDRELPADFTLSIGGSSYVGSDSKAPPTVVADGGYWWPLTTPGWSAGESVHVSLGVHSQETIGSQEKAPLIGYFFEMPSEHDGQSAFTFKLHFHEDPHSDFSYKTLRDHAFTVTGGSIENARRLNRPRNIRWEITVRPDGDGDVTIVLPATTDCAAQGAICTDDGRMLYNRIEGTVPGPTSEQET